MSSKPGCWLTSAHYCGKGTIPSDYDPYRNSGEASPVTECMRSRSLQVFVIFALWPSNGRNGTK